MINNVTIIGGGRVGGSIQKRCDERGVSAAVVLRTNFENWCKSTESIGDVLVVATKDNVLESIVEQIALLRTNSLAGVLVLHVNGSADVDVLSPLHAAGAITAAAHPFQTFSSNDPTALDGIGWGVQCSDEAWPRTRAFVEMLGGLPWLLADVTHERKLRYHAAAVAASNFTYAAYELARKLAEDANIPANVFLAPIMKRTVDNATHALSKHEAFAITGPLARGDVDGVRRQFEAIPSEQRDLYRHLSLALLAVVGERLGEETRLEMQRVLG